MKIVLSPDPGLREICEPVDLTDASIKRLAKQMAQLMYKNSGCGLAAPQVGVHKRIVVVDCDIENEDSKPIPLINPEIVEHSDEVWIDGEGCLSVPGITVQIPRFEHVTVRFHDLDGTEVELKTEPDLLGRCVQHEIDHLDGFTLFERLEPMQRIEALRDYEAALAAGAKPGDTSHE
jgi:peptide deformylase